MNGRLTLRIAEVADATGLANRAILEGARSGLFPPPVNPAAPVKLWVWSVAELARWSDPRGAALPTDPAPPAAEADPTPAHGMPRLVGVPR